MHNLYLVDFNKFNAFHTVVLRFNLLETVKHNKYIRSQITGCPVELYRGHSVICDLIYLLCLTVSNKLVDFVNLYMFRAYLGPSSGGTTVCIQQLVLIILLR